MGKGGRRGGKREEGEGDEGRREIEGRGKREGVRERKEGGR